ncbi:MAG TPA: bacillithiol biosynthesis deacetylase BshB1 [Chitinophagaceae bacterium]|nr:bacillithiol biosynthesis deacetylase BshB1 [Chitinophagaceae bacterium]
MHKVDILAIGVHPDDVELGCAGTIIKHIKKGWKVAVLDLTEGELGTRGTVAIRYNEAKEAAKRMGISYRRNMQIADGFYENNKENQLKLISEIRRARPRWIIGNAPIDRHPDHGRAYELIRDACFLSGLRQIITYEDNGKVQEAWRPEKVLSYIQDEYIEPDLYINISEEMDAKNHAIAAFESQFFSDASKDPDTYITNPLFLKKLKARALLFGQRIGVEYAEGFLVDRKIGIDSLDQLL